MNEPAIKLPHLNLFERFRRWLRQRRRKRLMELESFHAIARHFGREADSPRRTRLLSGQGDADQKQDCADREEGSEAMSEPASGKVRCEKCLGAKRVPVLGCIALRTCDRCKGEGWVAESNTAPPPLSGREPELFQCPKCAFTGNRLECFQTLQGLHCRECPDFPEMGPVLLLPKPRPPEPKGRVEFCGPMWRASIGNMFSYFGTEKECHQFIAENLP